MIRSHFSPCYDLAKSSKPFMPARRWATRRNGVGWEENNMCYIIMTLKAIIGLAILAAIAVGMFCM